MSDNLSEPLSRGTYVPDGVLRTDQPNVLTTEQQQQLTEELGQVSVLNGNQVPQGFLETVQGSATSYLTASTAVDCAQVALRVKFNPTTPTQRQQLFGGPGWGLCIDGALNRFYLQNGGETTQTLSQALPSDTPVLLLFLLDGGSLRVFFEGQEITSLAVTGLATLPVNWLFKPTSSYSVTPKVLVDQLWLFNSGVNQQHIDDLFAGTLLQRQPVASYLQDYLSPLTFSQGARQWQGHRGSALFDAQVSVVMQFQRTSFTTILDVPTLRQDLDSRALHMPTGTADRVLRSTGDGNMARTGVLTNTSGYFSHGALATDSIFATHGLSSWDPGTPSWEPSVFLPGTCPLYVTASDLGLAGGSTYTLSYVYKGASQSAYQTAVINNSWFLRTGATSTWSSWKQVQLLSGDAAQQAAQPATGDLQVVLLKNNDGVFELTSATTQGAQRNNAYDAANIQRKDTGDANTQTMAAHIANTSNPHATTKQQVGLGSVPNVDATVQANITTDATHRFITDTERGTWNNKIDKAGAGYTDMVTAYNAAGELISTGQNKSVLASSSTTNRGTILTATNADLLTGTATGKALTPASMYSGGVVNMLAGRTVNVEAATLDGAVSLTSGSSITFDAGSYAFFNNGSQANFMGSSANFGDIDGFSPGYAYFNIGSSANFASGSNAYFNNGSSLRHEAGAYAGFYGATPVLQPAAVADATDAPSVITQLNTLLARMRTLGLIAT